MAETRIIAALAYPGLQLLDIVGPLETFNLAAQQLVDDGDRRDPAYRVLLVSKDGKPVPSMSGLTIGAERSLDDPLDDVDTLLVPGALTGGSNFHEDPDYVAFVRRAQGWVRRLCSVCSGALLLASAGVLDGRRATTHWMDAGQLRDCFPQVRVEANRIYVEDGGVYTSGGITAGIDLALTLVEAQPRNLMQLHRAPAERIRALPVVADDAQPAGAAVRVAAAQPRLAHELPAGAAEMPPGNPQASGGGSAELRFLAARWGGGEGRGTGENRPFGAVCITPAARSSRSPHFATAPIAALVRRLTCPRKLFPECSNSLCSCANCSVNTNGWGTNDERERTSHGSRNTRTGRAKISPLSDTTMFGITITTIALTDADELPAS